ncbi:unnamed protein product [Amoebophrya sp. A120]|nr:unnamed protein product [Amoebophrya sp. A120]|eukprot:GSA120T00025739001.1
MFSLCVRSFSISCPTTWLLLVFFSFFLSSPPEPVVSAEITTTEENWDHANADPFLRAGPAVPGRLFATSDEQEYVDALRQKEERKDPRFLLLDIRYLRELLRNAVEYQGRQLFSSSATAGAVDRIAEQVLDPVWRIWELKEEGAPLRAAGSLLMQKLIGLRDVSDERTLEVHQDLRATLMAAANELLQEMVRVVDQSAAVADHLAEPAASGRAAGAGAAASTELREGPLQEEEQGRQQHSLHLQHNLEANRRDRELCITPAGLAKKECEMLDQQSLSRGQDDAAIIDQLASPVLHQFMRELLTRIEQGNMESLAVIILQGFLTCAVSLSTEQKNLGDQHTAAGDGAWFFEISRGKIVAANIGVEECASIAVQYYFFYEVGTWFRTAVLNAEVGLFRAFVVPQKQAQREYHALRHRAGAYSTHPHIFHDAAQAPLDRRLLLAWLLARLRAKKVGSGNEEKNGQGNNLLYVAEIGVFNARTTEFLLRHCQPIHVFAVDPFLEGMSTRYVESEPDMREHLKTKSGEARTRNILSAVPGAQEVQLAEFAAGFPEEKMDHYEHGHGERREQEAHSPSTTTSHIATSSIARFTILPHPSVEAARRLRLAARDRRGRSRRSRGGETNANSARDEEPSDRPRGDAFLDLVFIDGDHTYGGVQDDLESWPPLVHGIVSGHDCCHVGSPAYEALLDSKFYQDTVHRARPHPADQEGQGGIDGTRTWGNDASASALHLAHDGAWWLE